MVFSKLKTLAIATALFGVFDVANATPVLHDLGTLDKTLVFSHDNISGAVHGGAFDDVLYFKAGSLLSAIGSIVGLDGNGDLTGTYRFGVGDSFGTVSWSTSYALSPSDPSTAEFSDAHPFQLLQSGQTYWMEVAGSMSNGLFTAEVIPTFVPEPGSLALMLAGVGAMVGVARRRKGFSAQVGA